jgi:hypothetical protein
MECEQPVPAGARDLGHQLRVPPDVIDVERDADRTSAAGIERVAEVERVLRGVHAGAVGGIGRMQRLDRERQSCLLRIVQHLGDAVMHLIARCGDVLGHRAAGPRILRQAADDEHDAGGTERDGLVNGAAVVVACRAAMRVIGREHAAAAIARQIEPRVLHRAHGTVETDGSDLVAPGIDGADAEPRAGLDDGEKIALLADGCRVQRQPAVISGKIAHQASMPRLARIVAIRRVAASGSASSPAWSASRNSSARCRVERALSCPPTIVK